jgi:hypothetical protein
MSDAIDNALATPANRALRLLAYRAQGRPITEMAVEWAKTEICAGAEGASLAMLAGLWGQLDALEVEKLFEKALVEMECGPSETDYVLDYARLLCECIIEAKVEWDSALAEMYTLAGPPQWDERLTDWVLFGDDVLSVTEFGDRPALYRNLTKDNIAECLRQEAALFLKTHGLTPNGRGRLRDADLDRLVQAAPPSRTAPSGDGLQPKSPHRYGLLTYVGFAVSILLLGWLSWLFIRRLVRLLS